MAQSLSEKLLIDMIDEDLGVEVDPQHPIFIHIIKQLQRLAVDAAVMLSQTQPEVTRSDCLKIIMAMGRVTTLNAEVELRETIINQFKKESKDEKNNVTNIGSHPYYKLFN